METKAIEQRSGFVHEWESGQWTMAELCERYGISRPTGYKWARRFRDEAEGRKAVRTGRPRAWRS